MSMASSIEQYRKGTTFGDWADRLDYTFKANKVEGDLQKSHFMNLCGPYIYSQLKLLFKKDELDKADYATIVAKLKLKLDLTEPDLVQRFRFSQRTQQPDETAEEFVQAVKLQAEFCGFENFKEVAIIDRVLVGLSDAVLKENLLKEEKLDLAKLDKFITTWNIAKRNVHSLFNQNSCANYNYPPPEMINQVRRPVHERLGHPYNQRQHTRTQNNVNRQGNGFNRTNGSGNRSGYNNYNNHNRTQNSQNTQRTVRFQGDNRNNTHRNTNYSNNNRLNGRNNYNNWPKRDYSEMECDYCGELGHIRRKCFTLKNLQRDAVNFIEAARPGTSAEKELSDLMGRMRTADGPRVETSDDESYSEWNPGSLQYTNWKRGADRAARTA
ncbi:putative mediator of RNA polymerase II transcription subunit 29 isoform X1 [Culex quinquefasciatus]|uniref:putative mediator of RNA polymerase II transcription subunit 29 isoform X1 n=1 Tax=Culex quinquefasciatus TaxID=7176 RepID=UPI0018E2E204|nr:putative mediator of RNA polymerase II transcription subunit 29 isoform X1 [Culex quinquefasciatus]